MMKDQNEKYNIDLYSGLVAKHGMSHQSLNWGRKESQLKRFEVLSQIENLRMKSVLDVGCGLGDFWQWSKEKGMNITYKGIDITPAMIEKAKERFPDADFEVLSLFEKANLDGKFDYVIASGIFTYCLDGAIPFVEKMIGEMFRICVRGIGFNMLSAWADSKDENEFYADPLQIIPLCRKLTSKIVFRHDYHPGDFSIYLYKTDPQ